MNLTKLFRKSLSEGKLPKDWKAANVTVAQKIGAKTNVENFGPITV